MLAGLDEPTHVCHGNFIICTPEDWTVDSEGIEDVPVIVLGTVVANGVSTVTMCLGDWAAVVW